MSLAALDDLTHSERNVLIAALELYRAHLGTMSRTFGRGEHDRLIITVEDVNTLAEEMLNRLYES